MGSPRGESLNYGNGHSGIGPRWRAICFCLTSLALALKSLRNPRKPNASPPCSHFGTILSRLPATSILRASVTVAVGKSFQAVCAPEGLALYAAATSTPHV